MNDVLQLLRRRRSIRKFAPAQITDDELASVLEAGIYAPSGHNNQPWHFLVIQNRAVIDAVNQKTKEAMARSTLEKVAKLGASDRYHVLHHAPTVIIVSGRTDAKSPIALPDKAMSYSPLADCSAAIQNMLIAAESLGLGSCWVGYINYFFFLEEEVQKIGVPAEYTPLFAVCLGYKDPDSTTPPAPERKSNVVSYVR